MTVPTILVVEDHSLNLELVRDVLTTAGMKVIEASSGAEGLEVAARSIPVVALTAQAMVGDREQALAAGFTEHISKPIDTRGLAERIRALVRLTQGPH